MIKYVLLVVCLISLWGCHTPDHHNTLSGGTWMGYGLGVTEYSGKLAR